MDNSKLDPFAIANLIVQVFVAIGTLGAVFVAIWGEWFRNKFAGPRLSIEIHNNSQGTLGRGSGTTRVIYYHLRVINSRTWAPARRCRVLLRAIRRRRPDQQFYTVELPVSIPIFWAPRNSAPLERDIVREAVLDFGSLTEGAESFVPSLTVTLGSFDGLVRADEPVHFVMQVCAEGYETIEEQVFEVAWDGRWSDNMSEMARHLTLRKVTLPGSPIP
jgi:hypothetical protein